MAVTGKGSYPLISTWFRKRRSGSLSPIVKSVYASDDNLAEVVIFNNWFFDATSSTIYTLTAQGGNYSVTGQSANLYRHKNLVGSGGSYSITGQNTILLRNRTLTAQGGVYAYTGQNIIITYISGTTTYTLTAQGGTYALSGSTATLLKHRNLTASGGSYTYSGQPITISRNRTLTASGGNYNYTGQDATLLRSRIIVAQGGTYTLNGQSVTITWSGAGGIVWPLPSQVLFGVTYGPTGTEYIGTLDVNGIKYDITTGQLVKPINDKVVMTL